MRRLPTKTKLTIYQKDIVIAFIETFLPKRGSKRTSSGNELSFITGKIDRIIKKQFGFNVSSAEVVQCFEELSYDIFTTNGTWGEDKSLQPDKKGEIVQLGNGYSNYEAAFVYIDVEALVVRELRYATFKLPPNANDDSIRRKREMDQRIANFRKRFPSWDGNYARANSNLNNHNKP